MQRKDLTDEMIFGAIRRARARRDAGEIVWPADMLPDVPEKVVNAKLEQLCSRGLYDYGVTLRSGWLNADLPL